jgi:hypothetical protein
MTALLDAAGFYLDHGAMIAAAAVLLAAALAIASAAFLRLKRAALRRSDAQRIPLEAPAPVRAAAISDPQELLRSLSRARKSHVVLIGGDGNSPNIKHGSADTRRAAMLSLERFLGVYRHIPKDRPIDVLILHDREGKPPIDLSHTRRIAKLLLAHEGKVTVIVPYRGIGPVCLLALAGDEVIIGQDATLMFDAEDRMHTMAAFKLKRPRHMSDESLLEYHSVLQEARETEWLATILLKKRTVRRWRTVARAIAAGKYNSSRPARVDDLRSWGLQVTTADMMAGIDLPSISGASAVLYSKQRQEAGARPTLAAFAPVCANACPTGDVRDAMRELEQLRGSRLISIIHSPRAASDSVDDMTTAEALRAIRSTPAGVNLDIILHTPGGDSAGADQIVRALKAHRGKKTVFVPYHAFSAGTMIALTADEIQLTEHASLGPIDVQIAPNSCVHSLSLLAAGGFQIHDEEMQEVAISLEAIIARGMKMRPAAAYASLLAHKKPREIEDTNLVLAVAGRKLGREDFLRALETMKGNYRRGRARRIARTLNDGHLSHGFPIMYEEARMVGLHVKLGVPREVFTIVDSFLARGDGFCSVIHCSDQ